MSIRNIKAIIHVSNNVQSTGWGESDVEAVQQAALSIEGHGLGECKLVVGTQYTNEFSITYVTTISQWEHDAGYYLGR